MPSDLPPNVHPLPVFAPGVRDAVYRHVYRDPANELGGLLVGDRRAHGDIIVGAIPAVGARGDVTSLTFTQDSWASMLGELDHRYPGAEVLGWYHSHPGHGVFLSRQDRFIHQHFFASRWHIAVVVDPQRHYEGLFMWRDEGLVSVAEAPIDPAWVQWSQTESLGPRLQGQTQEPVQEGIDDEEGVAAGDDPVSIDEWALRREASRQRRAVKDAQHRRVRRAQAWSWLLVSVGVAAWILRLWT